MEAGASNHTTGSAAVPCPVCSAALSLRLARGRKSGKPFVMLICPRDGRHFRGFISDRPYVGGVVQRVESLQKQQPGGTP